MKQNHVYSIKQADIIFKNEFIADHPNENLPDWFFKGDSADYIQFVVDLDEDTVEFTPPMGPAPCWKAKYSSFENTAAMWSAFDEWVQKTF